MYQVPHEVFNIATDVPGFAEFCCVGLNERDADFFRNKLYNVRFPHTCGPDKKDVAFNISDYPFFFRELCFNFHTVKMRTYFRRNDFNRVCLAYDILVKVAFQLLRFNIEIHFRTFTPYAAF